MPRAWRRVSVSLAATILLLAIGWNVIGGSAGLTIFLWRSGEVVLPLWWKIDPWAPRLPDPGAIDSLADPNAKGRHLRFVIDKFYASVPETKKSWLEALLSPGYQGPAVNVSAIVSRYIPVGTTFDEAEKIVEAAGMSIVWPYVPANDKPPVVFGKPDFATRVKAVLDQYTTQPAGYMRFHIQMDSQIAGADKQSERISRLHASLNKQLKAPMPPVSFRFDVGNSLAVVEADIKIEHERTYDFHLVFHPDNPKDVKRVEALVGEPAGIDGRFLQPGIIVPIDLTVATETGQVIYRRVVDTQGHVAFGYLRFLRGAGGLALSPGLYRVRVAATKIIPALSNTNIEFEITYDARF